MFESGAWLRGCVVAGAFIIGAYVIFGGPSDPRRRRRRKRDIIPGLANIGNTCFLNALVQSLASCPLFMAWLARRHTHSSLPLLNALHNLLKVLNNEGGLGSGDACAGEVLGSLRGHGWVITSEEQDTHELFHVLTATIEDEIVSGAPVPSLLDISWLELGQGEASEEGLVLRTNACGWRTHLATEHKTQGHRGALGAKSRGGSISIGRLSVDAEKEDFFCKLNGEWSAPFHGEGNIGSESRDKETDANFRVEGSTQSCDREGCENGAQLNGYHNSQGIEQCGGDGLVDGGKVVNGGEQSTCDTFSETPVQGREWKGHPHISKVPPLVVPLECDSNENVRETSCPCKVSKRPPEVPETQGTGSSHRKVHSSDQQQDIPFRGYLASQLQCTLCGHKNPAQWSSFESLSLSLPSLPWGEVSLQELLDAYITREQVSGVSCEGCSRLAGSPIKTTFTKQLTIGKLPDCLCFHVKRTVWLENGLAIKRRDHLVFPEFLIMDPYTYTTSITAQDCRGRKLRSQEWAAGESSQNFLENCPITTAISQNATSTYHEPSPFLRVAPAHYDQLYRLRAVIVHVGDVFCGHFVTYRRGPVSSRAKNRWFYTSDLMVREASLEEVRKANAYMILYEKVA